MRDVVISIKPRFVDLILDGRKTVELRKATTRLPKGTRALIYASSPRMAVVAQARIHARHRLPVDEIWSRFGQRAMISEAEFTAYYGDAREGVALELERVRPLMEPVSLAELRGFDGAFRPPQSYMRLPPFLISLAEQRFGWTPRRLELAPPGI